MLTFTTWLWGDSYGEHYVRKLAAAVKRNTAESRFICFVDYPRGVLHGIEQFAIRDLHLTKVKGCFARLRLFDQQWQEFLDIAACDTIVNLDLDLVITGNLDWMDGLSGFSILQNVNSTNPCPYNGSAWSMLARMRPDVWTDFSLENYKALGVPFHAFPDDQGWFYHKIPDAGAFGPECGVYAFRKRGWPNLDRPERDVTLPEGAKIVAFPGWRDPSKFESLEWVKENWRE